MEKTKRIVDLFNTVAYDFCEAGKVSCCEVHERKDIHAFLRTAENLSLVVHLQGYPGMSSDEQMFVNARPMDYDLMINIRGMNYATLDQVIAESGDITQLKDKLVSRGTEDKSRIILPEENKIKVVRIVDETMKVSPGNEHAAVTGIFPGFPSFNYGRCIDVPYDAKILEDMLGKDCPELRI